MPSAPSEPEKYSIDEMMDRLKGNLSENQQDGQLVTRSDGSKARKVRKRKRRSSQPQKDDLQRSRRTRILQISGTLIILFITALAIGAGIIYANSSPFREKLLRDIGEASGSKVDLQQFRMNPKTANAAQLVFAWPQGGLLKGLSINNLSADIFPSSFFGKSLNGEEVTANYGRLSLQVPTTGSSSTQPLMTDQKSAIRFNRYRVRNLDIAVGDGTTPAISLTQSEGSLAPSNVNGRPLLSLYQGNLAISGWLKLPLDRALVEFRGEETNIIGLRILNPKEDRGSFELSGTVFPYRPKQRSRLAVSLDSFELAGIIGPELGRLFSGRINSLPVAKSNYLSFMPSKEPSPKLEIAFHPASTSRLEVQGFPFLFALSQLLEYQWFERAIFEQDSSANIHRAAGVVSLRDLKLESKGHLSLRGEISITNDQTLSGDLRVGVADGLIAISKNTRLKSMFGPPIDGFCWIDLQIGGSASAPTDTFKDLFSAAPSLSPDASPPVEKGGSSFRELTNPK
jgi:hypothetical protein